MLSFQILDGGQVIDFPLAERSVLIGAAPDCNVRLQADGVAPHHARVEPMPRDGATAYKIVDLGTPAGTRVNGDLIAQVALTVGDRIEVGAATLVFGRRVQRRATPDDVLDAGLQPRLRRRRRQPERRSWLPVALGAGVVLVALVVLLLRGSSPPSALVRLPELLGRGDHETATQILDAVRRDWVRGDAAREQVLAGYASDVRRQIGLIAALESEIRATAATRSAGDQIDELRRRQDAARDDVERAAVRRVLARLDDIRLAAPPRLAQEAAAPSPEVVAAGSSGGGRSESETADPSQRQSAPSMTAPPKQEPVEARVQRVRQHIEDGALRLAGRQLDDLASAAPEQARALRADLSAKAAVTAGAYRRQAEELVALGRGADAGALLRRVSNDFPDEERDELQRQAQAFAALTPPPPPPPPATSALPDPLGDLLRVVDDAESAWTAGDFALAQQRFADAARQVATRDAGYAAELEARRDDCKMVQAMHDAVAKSLRTAAKPEVRLAGDQRARLLDCEGARLRFSGEQGEVVVSWLDLPTSTVDAILKRLDAPASAYMGAAVLALAAGEESAAEQSLLLAARKETTVKPAVDTLFARVRGERVPDGGYKIEGGKLIAPELTPLVRELDGKLSAALARGDRKVREAVLSDVLARGPDQLEAVIQVLRRQQRGLLEKLQRHPFKTNWERLAAERDKLDRARASALELIFDEVRYFYPYAPPAVSGDKAKEYFAVQREVDARVAAVREIWEGCALKYAIPDLIGADLERLRWVTSVLDGFGEPSAGLLSRARWLLALPAQKVLDIQSFCRDEREVEDKHMALRIAKLNDKRKLSLNPAERDELELTNSYRLMMGRMPLAVDLRVLAAARAHCEEMERLGYFGHISPVAANQTPYDRMRLAGYGHGGSENIAANDSAIGAHTAWLHSSGHHRNILGIAHTEFACGQRGRLWTQNFGAGRDFEQDLPE